MNVAAVEDRGHAVVFKPWAAEVHQEVARWFWDREIFDFVGLHLHLVHQLSMRNYVLPAELKASGLGCRTRLLERRGLTGRRLLVARLHPSDLGTIDIVPSSGTIWFAVPPGGFIR